MTRRRAGSWADVEGRKANLQLLGISGKEDGKNLAEEWPRIHNACIVEVAPCCCYIGDTSGLQGLAWMKPRLGMLSVLAVNSIVLNRRFPHKN